MKSFGRNLDQRNAPMRVEQLNPVQWHVVDPRGEWGSGVTSWPAAVANALWAVALTGRGVESVDLDYNCLVLLRADAGVYDAPPGVGRLTPPANL